MSTTFEPLQLDKVLRPNIRSIFRREMSGKQHLRPLLVTWYLVMPFGLNSALAIFQSLINCVLRNILTQFVFVDLDVILMFFKDSQGVHPTHSISVAMPSGEFTPEK